jgi:hypothetical protein
MNDTDRPSRDSHSLPGLHGDLFHDPATNEKLDHELELVIAGLYRIAMPKEK